MKPIIKWVGGKTILLDKIKNNLPDNFNKLLYIEPFIGGGSVFMNLLPKNAILSDINKKLIILYNTIKNNNDDLLHELEKIQNYVNTNNIDNISVLYYKIRNEFNNPEILHNNILLSAYFITLNKLGYNGLYRENLKGYFNTPFGKKKQGTSIYNKNDLLNLSQYFNENNIDINCNDFSSSLIKCLNIDTKCFIYLDPPYDETYNDYSNSGFNKQKQIELSEYCKKLDLQGHKFLLSNSSTELINNLYKDFNIEEIYVDHYLNREKNVKEVLIKNY